MPDARLAWPRRAWAALGPIALLFLIAAAGAQAAPADGAPAVADPALERHVMHLAEQLRCLVCQNQTVAESHAQLALDLKQQVRVQLAQGRSDQDVIDFMVQRYGDFVLYRPPFKPSTWVLWVGPFLLLALGLGALLLNLRRRLRAAGDDAPDDQLAAKEN